MKIPANTKDIGSPFPGSMPDTEIEGVMLMLDKKNRVLNKLSDQIRKIQLGCADLNAQNELRKIATDLQGELRGNPNWDFIQYRINSLEGGFLQALSILHPDLTPGEMKLCILIRLLFSNKEAAQIFGIGLSAVEKKRFRLRQKMMVKGRRSLHSYLSSIRFPSANIPQPEAGSLDLH